MSQRNKWQHCNGSNDWFIKRRKKFREHNTKIIIVDDIGPTLKQETTDNGPTSRQRVAPMSKITFHGPMLFSDIGST